MVFEDIWAASAFKGATGPCAFVTDIGFHVDNHCVWLRSIRDNQSNLKASEDWPSLAGKGTESF